LILKRFTAALHGFLSQKLAGSGQVSGPTLADIVSSLVAVHRALGGGGELVIGESVVPVRKHEHHDVAAFPTRVAAAR
jgi:hypothetical protein